MSQEGGEMEKYLTARSPEWAAVFHTLREHRMSNMVDEDDTPYPLVDLMSNDGQSIETGEWEMIMLADDICEALHSLAAARTP